MDFIWAILAGSIVPVQAGLNAQLRNVLGHPVLAVLVSVAVSTVMMLAWVLGCRLPLSGFTLWKQAPWWVWLGGVFGALLLLATTTLAPRMGSLALIACIIAGQVICSVVFDHFGLLGFKQHSLNWGRVVGVLSLSLGVYLVLKY